MALEQIRGKVSDLATLLVIGEQEAGSLVARNPALIKQNPQ
jgi:hypothetical protein